jgi:bifunctional UDP-N-acetylglucosamine pyrophosphorylase/glucosamine-1-phosphate N-acetyltransferase
MCRWRIEDLHQCVGGGSSDDQEALRTVLASKSSRTPLDHGERREVGRPGHILDAVSEPLTVVVLAAGEGTRMRSATPKVLHSLCGDTMLGHVLRATGALRPQQTLVVVGHGRDEVSAVVPSGVTSVVQEVQGGTGHAVRTALEAYPATGTVLVVPGDAPLLTSGTLAALIDRHLDDEADATVLTALLADPTGYGRIVRADDTTVARIVEERDADATTKAIGEVAVSVYAFAAGPLADALGRLSTDNAQGEEYLTDVVELLRAAGSRVTAVRSEDASEVLGINDRVQLAEARAIFRDRLVRAAMLAGVTVTDPATTWLGIGVTYEADATIHQNTQLHGATHLAAGCVVGPNTTLTRTSVGPGATVLASTCTDTVIGPHSTVGPYSYLRPATVLGANTKVGAFVETKAAAIGDGAKVPHLAYVGDASVGERSNIGCGTVFVNYDGVHKHRTEVGADVRIGANNSLIAPLRVGDGAYTGADAVIRQDVPAGALAYSSNERVTREGWVRDNRAGPAAASSTVEPNPSPS